MSNNTNSKDAVVIERTFDAPEDLIWQMWTEPNISKSGTGHKASPCPLPTWMCASVASAWFAWNAIA